MKNIYKILIAFISVLAISCNADDVDNRPIVEALSTPEITSPSTGQTFLLDADEGAEEAAKFVWSPAGYSKDVVVSYTLLIDKKGGDFKTAKTLATTRNIANASVLVRDLNQAAIDLGAPTDVASLFDVRVISSVSGGVPQTSETTIGISVTPYVGRLAYNFQEWYLVGDATAAGWNTNLGNQPLFRDGKNANIYTFTGYFAPGSFKLISTPGQWAPSIGMGSNGDIQNRPAESDPDPANFPIAIAGYYTFTIDTLTNKYTLTPYIGSTITYTTVGIIGSSTAGGWDSSTAMTKSSFNGHVWTLGITALKDGEMKFRANDSWDVSWGGNTAFSGGGTGDNIPVAKSKYVIYFNDLDGKYLMIPNQD